MIKIKRGLDLPLAGRPNQSLDDKTTNNCSKVALLGCDYLGCKPSMEVKEGDSVKRGQLLFTDKKNPGVKFTAPDAGVVSAVNRGPKRVLLSVEIKRDFSDQQCTFPTCARQSLLEIPRADVQTLLNDAGLWVAFRTRPYSKVPALNSEPFAIFVTAIDTNPLAADPAVVLADQHEAFMDGLAILTRLTQGAIHLCKAPGSAIPVLSHPSIKVHEFSGPHPAGLAGTHIHFLAPVSAQRIVWSVNYQDVAAMGKLFVTGQLDSSRVVSLAGPRVREPRLVKTCLGASLDELVQNELQDGKHRIISGSVLSGRAKHETAVYLGRYHQQLSVIQEGEQDREFMHYLRPGLNKYSVLNVFLSKFLGKKQFDFNSSTNGSQRALVPVGTYEAVMPLDILPTALLRYLLVGDTDMAQALGCLELDEEDLALCTYACPGKHEFGPMLRDVLTRIEHEG
ncbi:MAG: Na(+)-translocating NADH-quinone reductase subunit A [Candidatus Margulisiibacteriota bacterium]